MGGNHLLFPLSLNEEVSMKKKKIFYLLTIATAIGAGGWILHQKFWAKKRYYGELSRRKTEI